MPLTANIERSYINMYKEGWEHSFQQKDSKFQPFVMQGTQASEFDFEERIGLADDMEKVINRYGDTPSMEVPHERRRIGLEDFVWGKGIDPRDLVRVASDPTNKYTEAGVMGANRKVDDVRPRRYHR